MNKSISPKSLTQNTCSTMAENQNDVERVKSLIKKGFVFYFFIAKKATVHLIDKRNSSDSFVSFLHSAVAASEESLNIFISTRNFLVKLNSEINASPNKVKQLLKRPDFQCDMALLESEISFQQRKMEKK